MSKKIKKTEAAADIMELRSYLQWHKLSGSEVSLLPDTLRYFSLCNKPMESGSDTKRFDDALSSSRFSNPAIESGRACLHKQMNQTKYFYKLTVFTLHSLVILKIHSLTDYFTSQK